ncbi:hypothetical protein PJP10_08985 [Mycobacterium kansasii]
MRSAKTRCGARHVLDTAIRAPVPAGAGPDWLGRVLPFTGNRSPVALPEVEADAPRDRGGCGPMISAARPPWP